MTANDFKGFAEAVSVLGRTKQVEKDWEEIDKLMDRRIEMLRDALGLHFGPPKQPAFCPVCGDEIENEDRFCGELCADRYYDDMEKDYQMEEK